MERNCSCTVKDGKRLQLFWGREGEIRRWSRHSPVAISPGLAWRMVAQLPLSANPTSLGGGVGVGGGVGGVVGGGDAVLAVVAWGSRCR